MQAEDPITINVNGIIHILPRSVILKKAPGSKFIQDYHLLNEQNALYYYRDSFSFQYVYEYLCGYDIYVEDMNKGVLINLLSDCDFYQLPELKEKLQKYITVNPEYDQQKIKELITYFQSVYSMVRPMINNLIPEFNDIEKTVSAIINDDESMIYLVKFYEEKPKYEFIKQDTQLDNLRKYFQRAFVLAVSQLVYKYVHQTYGDVYAKMLENAFPEYFKKVDETEKNWFDNVFSSASSLWSGLFTQKPKPKTSSNPNDSLNNLLNNIVNSDLLNSDLINELAKSFSKVLSSQKTQETTRNSTYDDVIKNLIDESINELFNKVLSKKEHPNTVQCPRSDTPDSLPDLVSDSESTSDEYDKVSESELEKS
jgi:hypothetical protein